MSDYRKERRLSVLRRIIKEQADLIAAMDEIIKARFEKGWKQ